MQAKSRLVPTIQRFSIWCWSYLFELSKLASDKKKLRGKHCGDWDYSRSAGTKQRCQFTSGPYPSKHSQLCFVPFEHCCGTATSQNLRKFCFLRPSAQETSWHLKSPPTVSRNECKSIITAQIIFVERFPTFRSAV